MLIKEFPAGRFVAEALPKRAEAIRRVQEETTLKAARTSDTVGAWKADVDKYPAGAGVAEGARRYSFSTTGCSAVFGPQLAVVPKMREVNRMNLPRVASTIS